MFKHFLVLMVVVGTAMCWEIPAEYKEIGDKLLDMCVAKTSANKELIMAAREGDSFPEEGSPTEATYKCYLKCIFENAGWFKDGKVDVEAVRNTMPDRLKPVYEKLTPICSGKKGEDDCDTTWKIQKCFYDNVEDKKNYFML